MIFGGKRTAAIPPQVLSLSLLAMKTEMPNLPEEIIFDILSRLPVVSLCRFRCVSRLWRSLISHPSFITTHLNRNTNANKNERLLLCDRRDWYTVELESSKFRHQSEAVPLNEPPGQNPSFCKEICGSCDGLVLMLDETYHCFLLNPSTRESRKLPLSPFTSEPYYSYCGFGYDSSIDDYKVVNIGFYRGEAGTRFVVSVYALKTNFWRKIEDPPYDLSWSRYHSGAFVCGSLHWAARNGTEIAIVALALADEKFRTMASPAVGGTGVLGGCLCVFVDAAHGLIVWVMKEYGVTDSWTKIIALTCRYYGFDIWKPLSLSRIGQVLLKQEGYKLLIFDPREEESKELVVHGRPARFEIGTYVESLISPWRL